MPLFKPNVKKMKAKRDVDGLINALNYKEDEVVRADAATALGKIGDARAVEPLIKSLKDKNSKVIRSATRALGDIGDERTAKRLRIFLVYKEKLYTPARNVLCKIGKPSVAILIPILKDDRWGSLERQRAIEILGTIGDKRALEHILIALDDTSQQVRTEAKKAIKDNGWETTEIQEKFPAALPGPIPAIEFVSLSEWKEGVGPGESYFEKALSHWNNGDMQSAAKAYEKALDLGLTQVYEAATRMNLGKIHFKQHDVVASVNEFQKVIYISPQRASTAYDSSTYLSLIYQVVAMSNDMQVTIELAKKAMEHVDYVFSGKAAKEIQATVRKIYNLTQ